MPVRGQQPRAEPRHHAELVGHDAHEVRALVGSACDVHDGILAAEDLRGERHALEPGVAREIRLAVLDRGEGGGVVAARRPGPARLGGGTVGRPLLPHRHVGPGGVADPLLDAAVDRARRLGVEDADREGDHQEQHQELLAAAPARHPEERRVQPRRPDAPPGPEDQLDHEGIQAQEQQPGPDDEAGGDREQQRVERQVAGAGARHREHLLLGAVPVPPVARPGRAGSGRGRPGATAARAPRARVAACAARWSCARRATRARASWRSAAPPRRPRRGTPAPPGAADRAARCTNSRNPSAAPMIRHSRNPTGGPAATAAALSSSPSRR